MSFFSFSSWCTIRVYFVEYPRSCPTERVERRNGEPSVIQYYESSGGCTQYSGGHGYTLHQTLQGNIDGWFFRVCSFQSF